MVLKWGNVWSNSWNVYGAWCGGTSVLELNYVAVRMGTVDMIVPEIQLSLGPSGLRKKMSCP